MAKSKDRVTIAAEKIADVLIGHMEETMTPAQAKTLRKDLHKLSAKSSRQSSRPGKLSQSAQNVDSRPLSHVSAEMS